MNKVQIAVADEHWQEFRKGLKGLSTEEKLSALHTYFDEGIEDADDGGGTSYDDLCLQVDNYIKALCRGGQLYPGESLEHVIQCDWMPSIKS